MAKMRAPSSEPPPPVNETPWPGYYLLHSAADMGGSASVVYPKEGFNEGLSYLSNVQ